MMGKERSIVEVTRSADGRLIAMATDLIVGAKNLVAELQQDALIELADRSTFEGREIHFLSANACGDRIWLSSHGLLASLGSEGTRVFENPLGNRNSLVGIRKYGDTLMAFQDRIMIGEPDEWRPLIEGFNVPGLITVEQCGTKGELCAISYTGQAFILSDGAVQPAPVF